MALQSWVVCGSKRVAHALAATWHEGRSMRGFTLLCSCILLLSGAVQAQSAHWVSTWGTATALALDPALDWIRPPPVSDAERATAAARPASPIPPVPTELNDQTVRMVLRSSVAGEQLRLQFAAAQGLPAVAFGAVQVALHDEGGAVVAGSSRVVTFGGKPATTLYAGALVVSDPVDLAVPALTELAVSIYLPGPSDARTTHALGLNTTYIASGNQVAAASLSGASSNRSYFWLTGVEVLAGPAAGTVLAFGDSITDGFSTTPDAHREWPALLAARLQAAAATAPLGVINMGISGNRVLQTVTGQSALARFDRDVLARQGVRWIVLLEGINDINFTALPGAPAAQHATAEAIITGLSQFVDRAHAHGIKVMGATLTPIGGLWLFNEQTEALRQAVNAWIRSSGKFDALVDFDAATRDPARPAYLLPAYDSGDFIHPNDAGNAAMAEAIDVAAFLR
jgi:lysophospholipase L1-like esterase